MPKLKKLSINMKAKLDRERKSKVQNIMGGMDVEHDDSSFTVTDGILCDTNMLTNVDINESVEQNMNVEADKCIKYNTSVGKYINVGRRADIKNNGRCKQNSNVEQSKNVEQNVIVEQHIIVGENIIVEKCASFIEYTNVEDNTSIKEKINIQDHVGVEKNINVKENINVKQNTDVEKNTNVKENAVIEIYQAARKRKNSKNVSIVSLDKCIGPRDIFQVKVKRRKYNESNKKCQQKRVEENRVTHNIKSKEYKKKYSSNEENRVKYNIKNMEYQKKYLSNEENRNAHNYRNKQCTRKYLCNEENRNAHNCQNKQCRRKYLSNEENRNAHNCKNKQCRRKYLSNEKNRMAHNIVNKKCQKKRLLNVIKRLLHNIINLECEKKRLSDIRKRKKHNRKNSKCQKCRLLNKEKAIEHKLQNQSCYKNRMKNEYYRITYNVRNKVCQRERLNNMKCRLRHRKLLRQCQKIRLSHSYEAMLHLWRVLKAEKKRLLNPMKLKQKQLNMSIRQTERLNDPISLNIHKNRCQNSYTRAKTILNNNCNKEKQKELFAQFGEIIKKGPTIVCCSCMRLCFERSIKTITFENEITKTITKEFIEKTCPLKEKCDEVGTICRTCLGDIRKGKTPNLSLSKKELIFPKVPACVSRLTTLEERFVCPRIPFMKIQEIPPGRQYKLKGRAVNVPADIEKCIKILPRSFDETQTIAVALKRKMSYKSSYLHEIISPGKIFKSLEQLKNCEVYKYLNVQIDETKLREDIEKYTMNSEPDDFDENSSIIEDDPEKELLLEEEKEPLNAPCVETLMTDKSLVFAPGENQLPLSLLLDEYAECMSFMSIYGGKLQRKPEKMTYQQWCRSRVIRNDRRFAAVEILLYMASKCRIIKIGDSISFCLRTKKITNEKILVQNLYNEAYMNSLIDTDVGFKMFAVDRGSPAFWSAKMKEVLAMVRQLGPPTFFLTVSAAETRWPELLKILSKVINNETLSDEQVRNLSFEEKCDLIQKDPVTCARYFEYKFSQLLKLLTSKNGIFGEYPVVYYYICTEFQKRGSPHCHCLLWLKNAPTLDENDENNIRKCEEFIDNFITCSKETENIPQSDINTYQSHKHTSTCQRKYSNGKTVCRFGIPFFPMRKTKILLPLKLEKSDERRKVLLNHYCSIRKYLHQLYKNPVPLTFDEFLKNLELTENDYIDSIRVKLQKTTVFIQRDVSEIRINNYNELVLGLFQSNMDIQFITDMYSVIQYTVNYVNKPDRGMSDMLNETIKEIRRGNMSLKDKFKCLGNKFINASEFCRKNE